MFKDAGIEMVLSGVQVPRMNSIMESWVQTCQHELLDRTLAAPLQPLPEPITDPERIAHLDIRRRGRLGGTLHEYRHAA